MEFLAGKNIIHGDLAARNVLLTGTFINDVISINLLILTFFCAPAPLDFFKYKKGFPIITKMDFR
jgi:hypothetical protein